MTGETGLVVHAHLGACGIHVLVHSRSEVVGKAIGHSRRKSLERGHGQGVKIRGKVLVHIHRHIREDHCITCHVKASQWSRALWESALQS